MDGALASWLKREEEEKRKHQEYMTKKNAREDVLFTEMTQVMVTMDLPDKTLMLLNSFLRAKSEGKNYTTGQKSAVTTIFYRYFDNEDSA